MEEKEIDETAQGLHNISYSITESEKTRCSRLYKKK